MMHSTQIHFARENLIFNSNSAQKNIPFHLFWEELLICLGKFGKNYGLDGKIFTPGICLSTMTESFSTPRVVVHTKF